MNGRSHTGSEPVVPVVDAGGEVLPGIVATAVLLLLRTYQLLVSPLLGPACRFAPSCSEYTRQAVSRYGVRRGLGLGLRRVVRCHPFHPGGWDPVR